MKKLVITESIIQSFLEDFDNPRVGGHMQRSEGNPIGYDASDYPDPYDHPDGLEPGQARNFADFYAGKEKDVARQAKNTPEGPRKAQLEKRSKFLGNASGSFEEWEYDSARANNNDY